MFEVKTLIVAAVLAQATFAQAPRQQMQQAGAMMAQQNWDGAIEILEPLVEASPETPQAWNWLGQAYHAKGDYRQALPAHMMAAEFPATSGTGMYNTAMAYARLGITDSAFAWLVRAKESRAVDLTLMDTDPDTESLRASPIYAELLPSADEFDDPFVEQARIIQEWRGEAAGDQFGWIGRDIGDVDGDGVRDVTTSAPTSGEGGPNSGKVYAYSSRTGELLWEVVGEAGWQLGQGIEAAGDVNADGVPDVVAGAPGGNVAFVYSGRDGSVIHELQGEQEAELFGRKVGDVGDLNDDGYDDVLIGAPLNDAAGQNAGRAYVYSGRDGSLLLTLTGERAGDTFGFSGGGATVDGRTFIVVGSPNAGPNNGGRVYVYEGMTTEPKFFIESDDTGRRLGGMFVSVVGDLDNDGTPDIYGSDWANAALGPATGRVFVHSGETGERLYTLTGEVPGDGFGIGVADAGDVDGDGHDDMVIGAWQHAASAASGGKIYVYSGRTGELMRSITGKVMGETFGFDATGVGDVDGDGTIDFLLTSAWSAVSGPRSGRMFIVSGAD